MRIATDACAPCHVGTRSSGPHRFVQVHVEMPGTLTLARAHEVAHGLEVRIADALGPGCDVIVHQDPFPLPGRP